MIDRQNKSGTSRREFLTVGGIALGLRAGARFATGGEPVEDLGDPARRLDLMRRLAKSCHLNEMVEEKMVARDRCRAEPMLRYSDTPRGIQDGTLWAWGDRGRPHAALKVERWPERAAAERWTLGVVSLCPRRIEVKFGDGQTWTSRKPGLELKPIPDAPKIAGSDAQRLTQMKELSRRFSVVVNSVHELNPLHLRLMPKPLVRYQDAEIGLRDGALFALAYGTNPTALLALEAWSPGSSTVAWRFGFARLGGGEMSGRLDDKEEWTCPFDPEASDVVTYMHRTIAEEAQ